VVGDGLGRLLVNHICKPYLTEWFYEGHANGGCGSAFKKGWLS